MREPFKRGATADLGFERFLLVGVDILKDDLCGGADSGGEYGDFGALLDGEASVGGK